MQYLSNFKKSIYVIWVKLCQSLCNLTLEELRSVENKVERMNESCATSIKRYFFFLLGCWNAAVGSRLERLTAPPPLSSRRLPKCGRRMRRIFTFDSSPLRFFDVWIFSFIPPENVVSASDGAVDDEII